MAVNDIQYGRAVLKVEPYGVEPVGLLERHGNAKSQFTLWLGANLTIADFALGFLPISFGLSWGWTIASVIIGNVLGALVVGLCAAMGPAYGLPQLMISRFAFGRVGSYLPALLNYVSTVGWFTVNNILGSYGLRVLFPKLAFWQGACILVVVQGLLAIYGHNLIHTYERIMSVVLGVLFLIASIIAVSHHTALAAYHPHGTNTGAMFAIMVAAAFSYVGSWGSYASDYSRYLKPDTPRIKIIRNAFLGSFIASVWLELVGAAVAVLAGKNAGDNISAFHSVMGGFGTVAVIAVILGGTVADALNLYSNSLTAGALDIKVPRWFLAASAALIGLVLSLLGSRSFEHNFDDFLLLLGYWMTPWLAILFTDFYLLKRYRHAATDTRNQKPVSFAGLVSFLVGIVVSIPFMSSQMYTGAIANQLGGADFAFYVGFIAAGALYLILARRTRHRVL